MKDAADFAIEHLAGLLVRSERLSRTVTDDETIRSLSRVIANCLQSVYWEKRDIESEGGQASTGLSELDRAEAKRLYDWALVTLEGEIASPLDIALALQIATSCQYARFSGTIDFEEDQRLYRAARVAWRRRDLSSWADRPFASLCKNTSVSAALTESDADALRQIRTVLETLRDTPVDPVKADRRSRSSLIEIFGNSYWRIENTGREFIAAEELWRRVCEFPLLQQGIEDGNQHDRINIASQALLAAQKVAPALTEQLWRAAAGWVGRAGWDAESRAGFHAYRFVSAVLMEDEASSDCVLELFRRLKAAWSDAGDGSRKLVDSVWDSVNASLPRDEHIGLMGAEALLQILLEELRIGRISNQDGVAEALVRLWTQMALDGRLDEALRLITSAWNEADQRQNPWIAHAVLRGVAVVMNFPEVGSADALTMTSWAVQGPGDSRTTIVDEARAAAVTALCARRDLGITPEMFIDSPERRLMDNKAAADLDRSLVGILARRITKSVQGGILEDAFGDLEHVRRLSARTPTDAAIQAIDACLSGLPEEDARRPDLVREREELQHVREFDDLAAHRRAEIARTLEIRSLRSYPTGAGEVPELGERLAREMLTELDWPFEPLYKASWNEIPPGNTAVTLVGRAWSALAGEAFFEAMMERRILAIRVAEPTFYDSVSIFEMLLGEIRGRAGLKAESAILLLAPDGATYINGTSSRIHALNENGRLSVTTERQVVDYVRFFCGAVQGDEGPFTITSSRNELMRRLTPGAGPFDLSNLPELADVTPKLISGGAGPGGGDPRWELSAHINYSNTLFRCNLRVLSTGNVEMVDDVVVKAGLPTRQARFRNGLRGFFD